MQVSKYNHHISWLREIDEHLARANSLSVQERNNMEATCNRVLEQNPASELALQILDKINRTLSSEGAENPEAAKMKHVVKEAIGLGIVREEVFPALRPTSLEPAYLLSSSHPATDHSMIENLKPDTIQTQVELFQLIHLMHRSGMTTPVHVEGRVLGKGYTPFPALRPQVEIHGRKKDIHDPETQAFLFQNPHVLTKIMTEYLTIAQTNNISAPIFYAFTGYPHIKGAQSKDSEELAEDFCTNWLPFYHKFMEKYGSFFTSLKKKEGGKVEMELQTGWGSDGAPGIGLGEQWVYCDNLIKELQGYLDYANKLAQLDEVREEELAYIFSQKSPTEIPMGFAGKAHEFPIVRHLEQDRETRVLTPVSSIQHNHLRRQLPINDPSCKLLWIDIVQKMMEVAKDLKPRT